jgi:membrane AbrB-like protein
VRVGGKGRWRGLADGALVVGGAVAVGLVLDVLGLPSPTLFGGLVAGLVRALAGRTRGRVPGAAFTGAQAVVGVAMGALVDVGTLRAVAENWLAVVLVVLGTLALSLVAGLLLRLQPGISPVTGAFAMVAGGASGIIVMARELGADERMVAVLQYLRVLLIVVLMPVVATGLYGATPATGAPAAGADAGWPAGLLFTLGCSFVGLLGARLLRIPVPALLGPMIAAAAVDLTGLLDGAAVPGLLEDVAFLVIGVQVGISFTRDSLRTIGRALPLALSVIIGLIVACAGLGAALAAATGASALDGYLATTPGGLYAVLATATGSGADATFVLAVQVLRLFVMLLSAPLLARWLRRSAAA